MHGREYGIVTSEEIFSKALVSSENVANAADGLFLFILMNSEIYGVDIYKACILVRTLDPEVVRIQCQGACVGLGWLLLHVLGSGRT
jgi:hypothetical protein